MRRQIERRKDLQELLPVFRQYDKQLELFKGLITELNANHAAYCKKVGIANRAAASRAMMSALYYGLRAVAEGDNDNAFARGFSGMLSSSIDGKIKVAQAEAQGRTDLVKVVKQTGARYVEQRVALRKQFDADFRKLVQEMKTRHGWTSTEFAFERTGSSSTETLVQNPFLIAAAARAMLYSKDASVEEMIAQAQACRRAAALVPSIRRQANELDVGKSARAAILGIGGTLANRAAARDLGSTGLPLTPRAAPAAGKLAHSLWVAYRANEPFASEVSDDVLQAYALGCAYGGALKAANAVLLQNIVQVIPVWSRGRPRNPQFQFRAAVSNRPDFWYDCARITSVGGNTDLALQCLQAAVRLGFREKEVAKVSPDLANVRGNPRTAAGFKKLFP
jgi:hypothetical protein